MFYIDFWMFSVTG